MSPHGVSPRSPVDPNTCCTCAVTQQPDSFFESNISHNKNDKPFSDFRPKSHHCDDLLLNKAIVLECFFGLRVWETTSQNVAYLQAKLFFLAFLTFNGSTATPSSTRAASQASIKERTTCRTEIAHMTRMMDFQKLNGYKNVENHS